MQIKDSENMSHKDKNSLNELHYEEATLESLGQARINKVYEEETSPGGSKIMKTNDSVDGSNKTKYSLNESHHTLHEEENVPGGSKVITS